MYNRTTLIGRLTADPELKQTPSNISVCSFTIAVDRSYTPKNGERQTDFISIVAWRNTAEFISRYFSKGDPILIEGELQSRKYTDKNGNNCTAWEVIAGQARFTGGKAKVNNGTGQAVLPQTAQNAEDFTELDNDGDLPF